MFGKKKEVDLEEVRVMRIYSSGDNRSVSHEVYDSESVVPTQAFPRGTFVTRFDYAIENPDGTLSWLQAARLYKGEEYAEFSGINGSENRGEVIWRK